MKHFSFRFLKKFLFCTAIAGVGYGSQATTFSTTLSNTQQYYRPDIPTSESDYGIGQYNVSTWVNQAVNLVGYGQRQFVPLASGNFDITVTGGTIIDTMLFLYQGSFNPLFPTSNGLVANDDTLNPNGLYDTPLGKKSLLSQIFSVPLTFGQDYTIVTTSWNPSDTSGTINFDISGISGVTLGVDGSPPIIADTTPPTVAITSDKTTLKKGATSTINFNFSEVPTGFDVNKITTTGGTLSGFAVNPADPLNYTATFTPTDNTNSGSASIDILGGWFTDAAGNPVVASSAQNFLTYNTSALSIVESLDGMTYVTIGPVANTSSTDALDARILTHARKIKASPAMTTASTDNLSAILTAEIVKIRVGGSVLATEIGTLSTAIGVTPAVTLNADLATGIALIDNSVEVTVLDTAISNVNGLIGNSRSTFATIMQHLGNPDTATAAIFTSGEYADTYSIGAMMAELYFRMTGTALSTVSTAKTMRTALNAIRATLSA